MGGDGPSAADAESGMNRWVLGARPRTLPAAIVPVALGASVGAGETGARWWTVPFAAVVSLALQVGVNYSNDYSDGIRGTDDVRVGPPRLVAGRLAAPDAVKRAAFAAFGVAALAGLVLAAATSWWLIALGAVSVLAAWFYTGGPKPYGYLGLGELFVFVFFGLVATAGTTFVVLERAPAVAWILGCGAGALACSLLVVNNLRDIPTDTVAGKRTLAVRLGDSRSRVMYLGLVGAAFLLLVAAALAGRPLAVLGIAAAAVAVRPVRAVLGGAAGRDLIAVLGDTGKVQLAFGVLVTVGVVLSG
jgi:1,4-dihydroxy-2-naphthoate octaprenyltransferase